MSRRCKYPWLTAEILRELYDDYFMSAEKVAAALGMPQYTVLRYMSRSGIPRRGKIQAYRAHCEFLSRYGPEWVSASQEIGQEVLRKYGVAFERGG